MYLQNYMIVQYIEYGASIWEYKKLSCISAIFLGVGKYTPNAEVTGDMG